MCEFLENQKEGNEEDMLPGRCCCAYPQDKKEVHLQQVGLAAFCSFSAFAIKRGLKYNRMVGTVELAIKCPKFLVKDRNIKSFCQDRFLWVEKNGHIWETIQIVPIDI